MSFNNIHYACNILRERSVSIKEVVGLSPGVWSSLAIRGAWVSSSLSLPVTSVLSLKTMGGTFQRVNFPQYGFAQHAMLTNLI